MNLIESCIKNQVGVIELARPDKFNCLSFELHLGLQKAIKNSLSEGAKVLLICAQGDHFCTGADLDVVLEAKADSKRMAEFIRAGHRTMTMIEDSPIPTAVAIQGFCLAGGLELMLSCDVAFAATDAVFGDQHSQFGLVPGWGGSQRLTRQIGLRRAMDMFFSARRISAETALDWGLINAIHPAIALRSTSIAYCEDLTKRSASGLSAMKHLARKGLGMPMAKALLFEEEVALKALLGSDVEEGIAAFRERRTPAFL